MAGCAIHSVYVGIAGNHIKSLNSHGIVAIRDREVQYLDIDRVIDIDGDLVLDGNRVFASSYQGSLIALDVASGRIVWGLQDASSYHGITQGFGNLYYCNDEGDVVAVRDESEDIVWRNEDLQHRSVTAPTAISNFVACLLYTSDAADE